MIRYEECRMCHKETITVELKVHLSGYIEDSGYCSLVCLYKYLKVKNE